MIGLDSIRILGDDATQKGFATDNGQHWQAVRHDTTIGKERGY